MWSSFVKKPEQIWMLWLKAKELKQRPSELLNIRLSNYVAYCLDEAVVFFGLQLEGMLDEAGQKPDKESARIERERKRVLDKIFGDGDDTKHFADPAVMFGN
jgi:hypothetical protein